MLYSKLSRRLRGSQLAEPSIDQVPSTTMIFEWSKGGREK
jgi:hypothetical protein